MELEGRAKSLRIYIGESDKWRGRPLVTALVEMLRREGIAGATVTRAVEGFGANSHVRSAHLVELSSDLPLVIEVVDRAESIERVLPVIDEMVSGGLITIADVEVLHYRHHGAKPD